MLKPSRFIYNLEHLECLHLWFALIEEILPDYKDKCGTTSAVYPYQYDMFAYEALRKVAAINVVTHADVQWVNQHFAHVHADLRKREEWATIKRRYFSDSRCHLVFSNSVPDYALDATLAYGYTLTTNTIVLGATEEWLTHSAIAKQLPQPKRYDMCDELARAVGKYPHNHFAYDTLYRWDKPTA